MSDRVFLDANILVSAAWRADNGLLALWTLTDVELLTSAYAIVEADRNVRTAEQRTRLHRLVQSVEIVDEPQGRTLPEDVRLSAKDVPILLAAIESRANYLLTGDKDHFGAYFDAAPACRRLGVRAQTLGKRYSSRLRNSARTRVALAIAACRKQPGSWTTDSLSRIFQVRTISPPQ